MKKQFTFALATFALLFSSPAFSQTRHFFYNITWDLPIRVDVYDMDNGPFNFVNSFTPDPSAMDNPKGIVVSANGPTKGIIYISYGCHADLSACTDGGHLLAYDLTGAHQPPLLWNKDYSFGIDSFSITPDGLTIYMPIGENSTGTSWKVIDAVTGNPLSSIDTGQKGPHNTIVSNDGAHVYLGAADNSDPLFNRNSFYLVEVDTSTNYVRCSAPVGDQCHGPIGQSIYGPSEYVGSVRPFTIGFFGSQRKRYALINDQTLIGFNVAEIDTGIIRYRVGTEVHPLDNTWSHGVTLSPGSSTAYVVDPSNNLIHVYDVSGIADGVQPSYVRNYSVTCSFGSPPCLHWLLTSRDGHYIFVANTNNVIDAWNLNVITTPVAIGDKFTEVDTDANGVITFSPLSRSGVGY